MIDQQSQSAKDMTSDETRPAQQATEVGAMPPQKEKNPVLANILEKYRHYAGDAGTELIIRAYEYALQAHEDQRRVTGEPYIIHPLAVALILTELEVDSETLAAALLHDTVEDTSKTNEEIETTFGADVAALVDGVTKLGRIPYSSKEEIQAENFRKMFLAMARDIRVVLIKLADRLHNMRTMRHMSPEKQQEKARETLDIYAPLAHRLGIYKIKWELEDLCLRYTDRDAYYELVGSISQKRSEREHYLQEIVVQLQVKIREMGIKAEIEGRPKHFYSIYRKMKNQDKSLDQIYDLFATRVIVETVGDCYAVLGLVHELYKPMPGRFKDYIAMPKPNLYQSLHTTVIGPRGIPFEVQIRTAAMHRTAEYGIAAHWRYKESTPATAKTGSDDTKLTWLRQLLEWQKDMRDAGEFMESLKTGLIVDEVFVFTPKGDVRSLPAGSVPVDFAYNIHSGIGNRMYGAKVNGRIVPLTYELKNGDIVEILTSEKVHGPSRDWLKIVKSTSARTKISQWFKKEMREENVIRGKEIVEREIKKTGFQPAQLLKSDFVDSILKRYTLNSLEDMYASIGFGGISAGRIIPRLRDEHIRSLPEDERIKLGYRISSAGQVVYSPQTPILADDSAQTLPRSGKARVNRSNDQGVIVKGIENCLVKLSRCCSPVPGDTIIGYVTRGKGVAVHRTDCSNIRHLLQAAAGSAADAERASRLIDVMWARGDDSTSYQVELKILARDRRHLLADVSNAIAEEKVSILSGQMTAMKDVTATLIMTIEVSGQNQYDRVLGRIKAVRDIIDVKRGH